MSRAGGGVEGRSPCRGYGATTIFKKLADLCRYIYWPNQNERGEEKTGDGSVANRSSAGLPLPAMKHGGAREGAGRKRSTNEQPHREREKFTKRCPVPIGASHAKK